MRESKKKLEEAQKRAEKAITLTNQKIEELGGHTSTLYEQLKAMQDHFNRISNIPRELRVTSNKLQNVSANWKQQVDKIEESYKNAKIEAGAAAGIGAGVGGAVVAMGPTAAMGVATTFGVASTGTAIASLSGAAATNAALAWLGGGAIVAGGGGMAAGSAFLALAGPIGWAIAGVYLLGGSILFINAIADQKRLEEIYSLISIRDEKKYKLAVVEINERIKRIIIESEQLRNALDKIKLFGIDYSSMTEQQQYELGSYVNFMNASTQLLVNPILGLMPDYTEDDLKDYLSKTGPDSRYSLLITSLCNLLYKIPLDETDKKLLSKSFERNKEFLKAADITKKEFSELSVVNIACEALKHLKPKKKESIVMSNVDMNDFQRRLEQVAVDVERSDLSEEAKRKMLLHLTQLKDARINLMITGCTGCGKSSTINAMFNAEKAKVGTGVDPETMDIRCYELDNLILWDSPGLGDGEEADKRHKELIIQKLQEENENGQSLIDLVLVIVDGSNRDMGTAFELINNVIIPNLGEQPEKRILIAINKADAAMSGRYWDYDKHLPLPKLRAFLDEKAASVKQRIKESTGVDVETIYYSAGFKEEGLPQESSYNLLKLLLYILRYTPDDKRIILMNNLNTTDEKASFGSNDTSNEQLTHEIAEELSRADIFKQCFKDSSSKGAEIGGAIIGIPGKVIGAVVGGVVGTVFGGIKAIFKRSKK